MITYGSTFELSRVLTRCQKHYSQDDVRVESSYRTRHRTSNQIFSSHRLDNLARDDSLRNDTLPYLLS